MNDIVTIMKAADFAARKHTNQKRKGEVAEPYLNHLIEVANLVAEATDGHPDVVVAALLHDAVEDQDEHREKKKFVEVGKPADG
jgi:(p)ppGpp synthase/HD superfamily hydrolase